MKRTKVFLIAAAMTLAGAKAANPAPPQAEYSADTVMETAEVSMKGRVHYTPTRERREIVMDSGGDKMITITRQDKAHLDADAGGKDVHGNQEHQEQSQGRSV